MSSLNCLSSALNAAYTYFKDIYIPVKTPTSNGMPDEFTWVNIGLESSELTNIYQVYYGMNYIAVGLDTTDDESTLESIQDLANIVQSVLHFNNGKYKKLIELSGYSYNPLWNVDGIEDYTYLENSGVNNIAVEHNNATYSDTNQMARTAYTDTTDDTNTRTGSENTSGTKAENHNDTDSVTTYDSSDLEVTDHNEGQNNTTTDNYTTTYNSVTDDRDISTTHGAHTDTDTLTHGAHIDTDTTTITHNNALNGDAEYSGGTDTFGNSVTGGDKYHNERRVRQGNIGVTKTQELIAAERENLRFNILQEFFNDLNKQVLVGIY